MTKKEQYRQEYRQLTEMFSRSLPLSPELLEQVNTGSAQLLETLNDAAIDNCIMLVDTAFEVTKNPDMLALAKSMRGLKGE